MTIVVEIKNLINLNHKLKKTRSQKIKVQKKAKKKNQETKCQKDKLIQ
jgi:hypothetical protein